MVCAAISSLQSADPDTLRIWETRPAVFDFLFKSTIPSSEGGNILVFVDRRGDTSRIKPGEQLGDYTLLRHIVLKEEVFKESVSAVVTEESHYALLRHEDSGAEVKLELGKPLEREGLMVRLIDTESRRHWLVQAGDTLEIDKQDLIITAVSEDRVVAKDIRSAVFSISRADELERRLFRDRVAAYRKAQQAKPQADEPQLEPSDPSPTIYNVNYVTNIEPPRQSYEYVTRSAIPPEYLYPPMLVSGSGVQVFSPYETTETTIVVEPPRSNIRSIHNKPRVTYQKSVTTQNSVVCPRSYHSSRYSSSRGSSVGVSYQDENLRVRARF
jgi:hypothetical protein